MNQRARNYLMYLDDMYDSMLRIEEYIEEMSYDEFRESRMVTDAVIRNLEIIGEASNKVPDIIKSKYPEIPWRQMYGLRNFVAHEYFGIDYENIWKIISTQMPNNMKDLERVIDSEREST